MKKTALVSLLVVALLLTAVAAYYTTEVTTARQETPAIVEDLLSSERVKLRLEDFPPERLEMLLAVQDPAFYTHHGMDLSTPGAGLTTLTQALVKFLYFDEFKPGVFASLNWPISLI